MSVASVPVIINDVENAPAVAVSGSTAALTRSPVAGDYNRDTSYIPAGYTRAQYNALLGN